MAVVYLYQHTWSNSLEGRGGCPHNSLEFSLDGNIVHCGFDQLWDAHDLEWDQGSTHFPLPDFLDFLRRYFTEGSATINGAYGHHIHLRRLDNRTAFTYYGNDGLAMDIPPLPYSLLEQLQGLSSAA